MAQSSSTPPGPRSRIPGRILCAILWDRLAFLTRLGRDYGDIVYFEAGPEQVYVLGRPDWIADVLVTNARKFHKGRGLQATKQIFGEGLLTSEGDFHRRQRRLAQPAFHRQRIAAYASTMSCYARRVTESWRAGETRDMHKEMMRLTLAVVGKTLFDADVDAEAPAVREAMVAAIRQFDRLSMPGLDILARLPWSGFDRAKQRFDDIVYRMIAEHRSGGDRGDLLSMLLMATDSESASEGDGGRMTDAQVRDEAMTILLAGHETTANALCFTWYLLAQHPDVEARFHEEVDRELAGRLPGESDFARLRYTYALLQESLRLYPTAWMVGRRAMEAHEIGGYTIPAGAQVLMSPYALHRDARYFPDPERFDPARWLTPMPDLPKFAYFPFGGGPRVCIGEGFAWMEGVLSLAAIAQRWCFRNTSERPLRLMPSITMRPAHGLPMTLHAR